MTFRLFLVCVVLLLPAAGRAMDCVVVHDGMPGSVSTAQPPCGSLKIVDRHREELERKISLHASYAVFDPPRSVGERRYNDWVDKRAAEINFSGPADPV